MLACEAHRLARVCGVCPCFPGQIHGMHLHWKSGILNQNYRLWTCNWIAAKVRCKCSHLPHISSANHRPWVEQLGTPVLSIIFHDYQVFCWLSFTYLRPNIFELALNAFEYFYFLFIQDTLCEKAGTFETM